MFLRHPFLSVATLAYLGVVMWVTLGPQPLNSSNSNLLWRFLGFFSRHDATDWITYSRVEFAGNILMFMPVGLFFLLLLGRRQWWLAVLFGVALTLAIEGTQTFLPSRVPDVRDLVANSTGGLLGVLGGLVLTYGKARRIKQDAARSTAPTRPMPTYNG
ncbi:VanZ family protein [Glaciihabitans sp. dw_435]|uniref:VanZ family protein n=1 Tax=Glaciihabitans sp. dw_435 TaxID=2720081 RepID=UPI001BD48446|nr:VanZ family protein [Glaciihabitans sp. dw_435]